MKTFLKYFLTFFSGIAFALLGLVLLIVVLFSQLDFQTKEKNLPENAILKIDLGTLIKEHDPSGELDLLISGIYGVKNMSLNTLTQLIKEASKDSKIKAIEINPGMFAGGMAVAEEIRNALDTFKKSGKPVWCYSENYSENSFLIASKANKIFANPKGMAEFNGFSSGVIMYKGLLDKLGVKVQVFKVGKFKGAVEPFTEQSLSEGNREQIQSYLNELFDLQLNKIAQDRNLELEKLKLFAHEGNSYQIKELKKQGLIDELFYYDEFDDFLKSQHKKFQKIGIQEYKNTTSSYEYTENKIAVFYLEGEIVPGKSESGDQVASSDVCKQLKKIREDKEIKALVLRINSPGGSSAASDIIAREIEITKKIKPVIVSFGNVAASGGYYIGCVGDSIFADPKTITGSIGVFALIPNTQKFYEETLGLRYQSVNSSKNAELWRPDKPLSDFQSRIIQGMIEDVYSDFINIVSRGRKIPREKVEEIAQGKVYSGLKAKEIGLIDGFGGIDYCIGVAAKKSQVKGYRVVNFPERKDPFEQFLTLFQSKMAWRKTPVNSLADDLLQTATQLESMMGIQARLPWSTNFD
jgi:protease-4